MRLLSHHPLYLTTVFLRRFVVINAYEKQVTFVAVECLTIVFLLYLLQCASCAFVVFQLKSLSTSNLTF